MAADPRTSDYRRRHEDWVPQVELNYGATKGAALATKTLPIPKYSQAPPRFKPSHATTTTAPPPNLNEISATNQEALVVEDLLYILMGVEGTYVRFSDTFDLSLEFDRLKGPEFRVNKYVSSSLKDLTKRIVAIATAYMGLREFLDHQSKREFGMVNQALCASLRENLLKEYSILVAQLEYQFYHGPGPFSLQQFHLQLLDIGKKLQQGYELGQIILRENAKKSEEAVRSTFDDDLDKVIESLKLNNTTGGGGSGGGSGGGGGAGGAPQSDNGGFNQLLNPASKSNVCKGGTILRILSRRLTEYSGDPDVRQLLTRLLQDASKPYLRMLDLWINKGIILDPHEEFLVREKQGLSKNVADMDYSDEYWDKRYTVRKDDLPVEFGSPQVYERILLTGKYLNVIRECGGSSSAIDEDGDNNSSSDISTYSSISDSRILKTLSKAYTTANRALLNLIITTHDLPTRLRSLKHYFFLDRADFFINFMDIAERELVKPLAQSGSKSKLQYLLDMALRQPGSLSSHDPFRDEVLVDISHISVTDYLLKIVSVTGMDPNEAMGIAKGSDRADIVERMVHAPGSSGSNSNSNSSSSKLTVIQGLQLDFKIPFPLSLVLSRKTILRYQLIFRHLVEIKNIERILKTSWIEAQKDDNSSSSSVRVSSEDLREWKLKAAKLRTKMIMFIQQILYFCTMEVIEPNWKKFAANNLVPAAASTTTTTTTATTPIIPLSSSAATVDGLMEQHVFYLDTCMKECMLTNEKLLKLQNKLFSACRLFGEFLLNKGKATVKLLGTGPERAPGGSSGSGARRPINHKTGLEVSDDDLLKYLQNSLKQYENSFDHHIKVLIEALNYYSTTETTVLLNLSHQLQVFFELA